MLACTATNIGVGVILLGTLQFLASLLVTERLKTSLQKEHSHFLEKLKWDLKVREQAVKVAEYLSLIREMNTSPNTAEFDYQKLNQLSWELALWLPEKIYKEMVLSIKNPTPEVNELTTIISIRKLLLEKNSGNLAADDIAHHGVDIGKKSQS